MHFTTLFIAFSIRFSLVIPAPTIIHGPKQITILSITNLNEISQILASNKTEIANLDQSLF